MLDYFQTGLNDILDSLVVVMPIWKCFIDLALANIYYLIDWLCYNCSAYCR